MLHEERSVDVLTNMLNFEIDTSLVRDTTISATRRLVDLSVGTMVHTTISQDGLRDTLCVILNGK